MPGWSSACRPSSTDPSLPHTLPSSKVQESRQVCSIESVGPCLQANRAQDHLTDERTGCRIQNSQLRQGKADRGSCMGRRERVGAGQPYRTRRRPRAWWRPRLGCRAWRADRLHEFVFVPQGGREVSDAGRRTCTAPGRGARSSRAHSGCRTRLSSTRFADRQEVGQSRCKPDVP